MTLKLCDECKKEISSTSSACPHCGYKPKASIGMGGGFLILISVFIVLGILMPKTDNNQQTLMPIKFRALLNHI